MSGLNSKNVDSKIAEMKKKGFTVKWWREHRSAIAKGSGVANALDSLISHRVIDASGTVNVQTIESARDKDTHPKFVQDLRDAFVKAKAKCKGKAFAESAKLCDAYIKEVDRMLSQIDKIIKDADGGGNAPADQGGGAYAEAIKDAQDDVKRAAVITQNLLSKDFPEIKSKFEEAIQRYNKDSTFDIKDFANKLMKSMKKGIDELVKVRRILKAHENNIAAVKPKAGAIDPNLSRQEEQARKSIAALRRKLETDSPPVEALAKEVVKAATGALAKPKEAPFPPELKTAMDDLKVLEKASAAAINDAKKLRQVAQQVKGGIMNREGQIPTADDIKRAEAVVDAGEKIRTTALKRCDALEEIEPDIALADLQEPVRSKVESELKKLRKGAGEARTESSGLADDLRVLNDAINTDVATWKNQVKVVHDAPEGDSSAHREWLAKANELLEEVKNLDRASKQTDDAVQATFKELQRLDGLDAPPEQKREPLDQFDDRFNSHAQEVTAHYEAMKRAVPKDLASWPDAARKASAKQLTTIGKDLKVVNERLQRLSKFLNQDMPTAITRRREKWGSAENVG